MELVRKLRAFLSEDNGVATIDWVAITAASMLLGVAIAYHIYDIGLTPMVESISADLAGVEIVDPGPNPAPF